MKRIFFEKAFSLFSKNVKSRRFRKMGSSVEFTFFKHLEWLSAIVVSLKNTIKLFKTLKNSDKVIARSRSMSFNLACLDKKERAVLKKSVF